MTPYAQMLAVQMRPEAQATFAYEYQRYAKDPVVALVLTLCFGIIGGESYYIGKYARGILMSLALFTGVGLFITVPMWIVRCFTIQNEVEAYNDYVAYLLAARYWPAGEAEPAAPPEPPEKTVSPSRPRATVTGLPMTVRQP